MMNNKILDIVVPIQFKNTLLIPIKLDVKKLFETNKVKFQILIKDDKIIIESPEITASLVIRESPLQMEALNVT